MGEKNHYQGCKGKILANNIEAFDFKKGEYIAEEKYDGIWCDMRVPKSGGTVKLISRTMKEKDNEQLASLRAYLLEYADGLGINIADSDFIGELAFSSQKGTEFAREHGHHKIDLIDITRLNGEVLTGLPILKRKEILKELFHKADPLWLNLGWYLAVKDAKQVQKVYDAVVKKGGEGLIIKDVNDMQYRYGDKSPLWYKIKKPVEFDYVIMGYSETNSVDFAKRGWIGGLELGLYVGDELINKLTVGSMSFEWREEFSRNRQKYIGKVVTIGGFEIFKSGAVRHPFFVGMHDDKAPEECVWDV